MKNKLIIKNGINDSFTIRLPDGKMQRFGKGQQPENLTASIRLQDGGFVLIVNGVVSSLSKETEFTIGYHDIEHSLWYALKEFI